MIRVTGNPLDFVRPATNWSTIGYRGGGRGVLVVVVVVGGFCF